ncbi:MAG: hypothetical protein HKL85_04920 [Acidimicrobiaceae bacterium]|nr:hypothetical protein [Acidimicrobiaceae bacterium]
MPALTASANDVMRRAIAKMDSEAVMRIVDALQIKGSKLSAVIAVPLRNLQKKRDVTAFATGSPIDAVSGLLELLAMEPLEKVIEALGEHAETPTYDELLAAITTLRGASLSEDELVAVLAFAIGHDFPAAPHCRRILGEDETLALPEIEVSIGHASILSPKVVDETVREQRRARREEEKVRKQAQAAKAKADKSGPKSKVEKKKHTPSTTVTGVTAHNATLLASALEVTRRAVALTPAEAAVYDATHPLAGWVVTTEVPFDDVDPIIPEQQSKIRPAVVVAASNEGLLVRGIYTNASPTRSLFSPWRRMGLDHVSYIEVTRSVVSAQAEVNRLGALSAEEWNALI